MKGQLTQMDPRIIKVLDDHITLEVPGNTGAWICACGNTPAAQGFYPCDRRGEEITPSPNSLFHQLYYCDRCGAIINADDLKIVGQRNLSLFQETIR